MIVISTLDKLLVEEENLFRREEAFLRHFASHVKGIHSIQIDQLVSSHLKDCTEYFSTYGTIDGPFTPWMLGNRGMSNGKKENS